MNIERMIKDKRAQLAKIMEQEAELRREQAKLKALEDAVAAKPKIEKHLAALEMTLALAEGKDDAFEEIVAPDNSLLASPRVEIGGGPTLADIVEEVLRQAGKPQTAHQLMALMAARGKNVKKKTLTGGLYGWIRRGKRFRLFGSGLIGLMDWKG